MFRVGFALALILATGCKQLLGFDNVVAQGADAANAIDTAVDTPAPPAFARSIVLGSVTGGPHVDFPLLFAVTLDFLRSKDNGGDVESSSGFDIAFAADQAGATRLAHEVERYDETTGELIAWVKVPMLASATTLFLLYGDAAITASQENAAALWSDYAGVWHLDAIVDATGQSGTTDNGTTATTGKIAGARSFIGGTRIDVAATAANANVFEGGGTVSAWVDARTDGQNNFGRFFDKGFVLFGVGDGTEANSLLFSRVFSTSAANWNTPIGSFPNNHLAHVVAVYDSSVNANLPKVYVDGTALTTLPEAAPTGSPVSDAGITLVIGNRPTGARGFDGVIDELRLSRGMRDAGWIATEFANQSAPASFYTISEPLP